jgi:hypothetical protein
MFTMVKPIVVPNFNLLSFGLPIRLWVICRVML